MFTMRFDMRGPGATPDQRADLYQAAIDMAAWADGCGCVSVVLSEHHRSPDGYLPSPLPLAGAMAAVTKTTPIVVAATLLPFYDPVRLAEDMIVLDHISRGRMMFVLGIGYRPEEYDLYGADFGRPRRHRRREARRPPRSPQRHHRRHTGPVHRGRADPRLGRVVAPGCSPGRPQRARLPRPG